MTALLKIFMGLYIGGSFNPMALDRALGFSMQWFPLALLLLIVLYAGLRLCRPETDSSGAVRNDRRI